MLLLAVCLFVAVCHGFVPPQCATQRSTRSTPVSFQLCSKKDDDDDLRRNFYQREEESSKQVFDNLVTGPALGSAITTAGWAFVAFGFLLNLFGYDYVVKDGRVTIDTVEARQFQKEVKKAMKQQKLESSAPSAINTLAVPTPDE